MRGSSDTAVQPRIGANRAAVFLGFAAALTCLALPAPADAQAPISTIAGGATFGFAGDGGPATSSLLSFPVGVTPIPGGGLLIADQVNYRIRRIAADGTLSTLAGTGAVGSTGDGGPATAATFDAPSAVAQTPDGGLLISDANNNRVRRVAPNGTITNAAGTGLASFNGDGIPATTAHIRFPFDVVTTADGGFLVADSDNNRVRKVGADGKISTFAGNGVAGSAGDGAQATAAQVNNPMGLAITSAGEVLIAERNGNRIRSVSTTGTIATVAGTGAPGYSGDDGPATAAKLSRPTGVAALAGGGFVIADRDNNRIRSVSASGTITTIAGTGVPGFSGDGGPATAAQVNQPLGVDVTPGGNIIVADTFNHRLRKIGNAPEPGTPPSPSPGPVPAKAIFTSSATKVRAYDSVTLDASASVPAGTSVASFAWDVDGDGKTDARCGPETPALTADIAKAGSLTARLSVTDTSGTVTTATRALTVGTRALSPKAARAKAGRAHAAITFGGGLKREMQALAKSLEKAPVAALCTSSVSLPQPLLDVTELGGPGIGCFLELQIELTQVAAVGCLRNVPLEQLPDKEQQATLAAFCADKPNTCKVAKEEKILDSARTLLAGAAQSTDAERYVKNYFTIPKRFYYATTTVRINGLDYTPNPGAAIVIAAPGMLDPQRPFIISSGATVSLPTETLRSVPIRKGALRIPINKSGERIAALALPAAVRFLPGTDLDGNLDILLRYQASRVNVELLLPSILSKPGGGRVSVSTTLTVTNRGGLKLNTLEARDLGAELFGVGIEVPFLRYDAGRRRLEGAANVYLTPGLGDVRSQFAIGGGRLEQLDLTYNFGPPGVKVGPAVFLISLNANFEDSDETTSFGGGVGLAAGAGYGGGCAPVGVKGSFNVRLRPAPLTFTAKGIGSLMCIDLVESTLVVAADGYGHFSSSLDKNFGPFSVKGGIEATYFDGHFNAEGQARGCIGDFGCIGGNMLISDRGMAVCVDVLFASVGAAINWVPPPVNFPALLANITLMGPSCDVGPWRTVVARPAARAAQDARPSVDVAAGKDAIVMAFVGATAPPRVRLSGPGGQALELPAGGPLKTADAVMFRVAQNRTTYAQIKSPAAGRWTVTDLDGGAITEVRSADMLPAPRLEAKVLGAGNERFVDYTTQPQAGQVFRVLERAPGGTRELGVISGSGFKAARAASVPVAVTARSGTLRFTPSDARGTKRTLLAVVEQNGMPRKVLTLARFTAGPPPIGRVTRIRAQRRGRSALRISWAPAAGAEAYAIGVELSDGRRRAFKAGRRSRSITIPSVARGTRVRLRVIGTRAGGARKGPVTSAVLRAR